MSEEYTSDVLHLKESINELNQSMERSNSLRWSLLRGLFIGIGSVIGATLLGAVVVWILVGVLQYVDIPVPETAKEILRQ